MEFTEKQMEQLVSDVKAQLSQLLKGETVEKEALAKSETPPPTPEKVEEKPLEKREESSSEAKKAEESESETEKSKEAKKAEESESETEKSKEAKKAEESSSSSMEKAYKEMSKSERETHYKALKRFIWEDQGFEIKKAEESSKACKAEESSSAKKAEESTSESTAEKAESSSMSKAEEELVTVKAENENLRKNVEQLIASLNKVIVKGPDRKSIAGVGEVVLPPNGGASEMVEEPVLRSQMNVLTRTDKLTKTERETINDYVLFGKGREDVLSIVKEKAK